MCQAVVQIVFIVVCRLRVYRREMVPASGAAVIASNHQSYLDPMVIGAGVPRPLNYVSRSSLFKIAPFRWLISSVNAFPVHREGIDTEAIREAIRRVSNGGIVVIFPEGTRTRDGKISEVKKGAGNGAGQVWVVKCIVGRRHRGIWRGRNVT